MTLIAGMMESQSEVRALDKMFKFFDKDNTGILTLEEIKEGTEEIIGAGSERYEESDLCSNLDIQGDGKVNYEMFRTATLNRAKLLCKQNIDKIFEVFDTNGDGFISLEELKGAFQGQINRRYSHVEEHSE